MADLSSDSNSVPNEIIVSELLCYFQNKIENLPHDVLIKIVVDFYSKEDIHFTKTLLFDKCKETAIRLKKYNVDSARLDCRDIINKLNEVGVDCPIFVAQDVGKLPLATPDTFDLAKISKNICEVMKIEENVVSSFTALSCLQNDFQAVIQNCAKIDGLVRDITDVKLAVSKRVRNVISDTSTSDDDDDVFSETDTDDDTISVIQTTENVATTTGAEEVAMTTVAEEVGMSNGTEDPTTHNADGPGNRKQQKVQHPVLRLTDRPVSMASWLKEDGYTMVEGNKSENKHKSVFVNSSRQKFSEDIKLKAVKFQRFANYNRNNGYSRGDHGQCEVFVSRLDPQTTPRNVCQFLRSRFNKSLKVEQIKARFDTYASFKIFAPKYMKRELLNKYNWDDSGDIYVREFITKSTSYKSQY